MLGAPSPIPFGPVEAPPGPVPSDWVGVGAVPGEIPGAAASSAPVFTAVPAAPDDQDGSSGDEDGPAGLLAGLALLGLAMAGFRLWRSRRRPAESEPAPDERAA